MQNDDNANVEGETENIEDDVNNVMACNQRFSGNQIFSQGQGQVPFDLDTANGGNRPNRFILTLNGRGRNGFCKKRTGTITIDLIAGTKWTDAGAILKYTFNNVKIEDTCRNRSVTLNGERFVTNVNGGNLFTLRSGNSASLVHKIRSGANGITATFIDSLNNTRVAVWNIAKRLTIQNLNAGTMALKFTTVGDSTVNGISNTSGWGTTRNGKSYQNVITTAIVGNTECQLFRPTSGEISSVIGNFSSVTTFGLNALGNPSILCPTHFRVTWTTSNGNTGSALIPYR